MKRCILKYGGERKPWGPQGYQHSRGITSPVLQGIKGWRGYWDPDEESGRGHTWGRQVNVVEGGNLENKYAYLTLLPHSDRWLGSHYCNPLGSWRTQEPPLPPLPSLQVTKLWRKAGWHRADRNLEEHMKGLLANAQSVHVKTYVSIKS